MSHPHGQEGSDDHVDQGKSTSPSRGSPALEGLFLGPAPPHPMVIRPWHQCPTRSKPPAAPWASSCMGRRPSLSLHGLWGRPCTWGSGTDSATTEGKYPQIQQFLGNYFLWSPHNTISWLLTETVLSKSFRVLNNILCQLGRHWLTMRKRQLRKAKNYYLTSRPNTPLLTHTNRASPGKKTGLLLG